jgi:hypothetical protein
MLFIILIKMRGIMLLKKSLTSSLVISMFIAGLSPASANGQAPAHKQSELESRVKRIEERAVMSDSKRILISGWVNRALQWADNGFNSNFSHVSPDNVTSNLQIKGTAEFSPTITVGTNIQIDFGQNGTNGTTGNNTFVDIHRSQTNAISESRLGVRVAEVVFDSAVLGKVSAGRGYMASAGVLYYTDLSGTFVFLHPYSSMGGISFRNRLNGRPFNPNPLFPNSTLKPGVAVFEHGDGGSIYGRNDRIRYDSPNFYGFSVSTSHAYQNVGDLFDVAVKFAAILAKFTIVAQTSWARNHTRDQYNGVNLQTNGIPLAALPLLAANPAAAANLTGPKFDTFNGAIGVLTPLSFTGKDGTGLNFHFSGVHRKWDVVNQANGRALQGKIGYLDEFYSIGKTALVTSYGQWKAMDVDFYDPRRTMTGTNWGVGVVQNIDVVGTSLYLRYDNYKLKSKRSFDSFKPVDIVYAGALVKL